jgi:hypothetical protein
MTRIDTKALGEIEALVQERAKYEKWISSLGERRNITPSHVFQRVLADYEERMRAVAADLSGRTGDIEASIIHLRERLTVLQHEESAITDERAEAELRAAVGEYSADKWEEIRRVADENIARLSSQRMELGGELAHLETILSVAGSRPSPVPPGISGGGVVGGGTAGSGQGPRTGNGTREPAPRPSERTEPVPAMAQRTNSPLAAPVSAPVASLTPPNATGFDELAFLSSVVETELSHMPSHPADMPRARTAPPAPAAPRPALIEHDAPVELTLRSSPTPVSNPASSRNVRSATPMISESIHSAPDGKDVGRMQEEPVRAFDRRLSGSVPAYLKDVAKEATKSLKCQECGTMNYPTEWYCERCGGELAAL